MQTKEYRTIDKSTWGPGPWQDEPDKIQWQDEATGLPCLIVRVAESGHLCGYVGIAPGHPWYELEAGRIKAPVHCGLNFGKHCQLGDEARYVCHVPGPGEPDHLWWLGFDCGHAFDLQPGIEALLRRTGDDFQLELPPAFRSVYRDIPYVRANVARLACVAFGVKGMEEIT